ncbi:hypothetical protein K438DRAFT_1983650 [Mycena galopus ATCC 62051]|nr:hypothetical protein K438DRAFT_1983650 [Mycena galopus ATCC 62051]
MSAQVRLVPVHTDCGLNAHEHAVDGASTYLFLIHMCTSNLTELTQLSARNTALTTRCSRHDACDTTPTVGHLRHNVCSRTPAAGHLHHDICSRTSATQHLRHDACGRTSATQWLQQSTHDTMPVAGRLRHHTCSRVPMTRCPRLATHDMMPATQRLQQRTHSSMLVQALPHSITMLNAGKLDTIGPGERRRCDVVSERVHLQQDACRKMPAARRLRRDTRIKTPTARRLRQDACSKMPTPRHPLQDTCCKTPAARCLQEYAHSKMPPGRRLLQDALGQDTRCKIPIAKLLLQYPWAMTPTARPPPDACSKISVARHLRQDIHLPQDVRGHMPVVRGLQPRRLQPVTDSTLEAGHPLQYAGATQDRRSRQDILYAVGVVD